MSTSLIVAAMRKKYTSNAYALLFEVGNGTGSRVSRHADAIAMSLWPSRGMSVIGFEFKASRTDWLRELKDPAKSAPVQQYCDQWWVVISDSNIVKDGELPPTWGLMALSGGVLNVVVDAPRLEAKVLDRHFVAAVLRRAAEPAARIDNVMISEAEYRGELRAEQKWKGVLDSKTNELRNLAAIVAKFESETGIRVCDNRWNGIPPHQVSLAIKSLSNPSELQRHVENLEETLNRVNNLAGVIRSEIDGIEKLRERESYLTKSESPA